MSGMDVPASSDRCADMTLNAPHHCPDWDFMFIRPGDPEMECCLCEHHNDATRRAALYDSEREKEDGT